MNTNGFSTEKLLRLAFQNRLISDYRMTPFTIELCNADGVIALDPEEARFYLRGLVEGFGEWAARSVQSPAALPPRAAAA